jgi:dTDP-glucose 4,6-dehydratase|tara:strand:- start:1947 stop:2930 length:984 start_codon:yes stop_codon:yes gene_type:complete
MKKILITGGAGFIGSNLIIYLINKYKDYEIINVDSLTYASNLNYLSQISSSENYTFYNIDIRDFDLLKELVLDEKFDFIIHLAAESHVDNSINNPLLFAQTNILGTINLLNSVKELWNDKKDNRFYHVSTDEVYGTLGDSGSFHEKTNYDPRSPYSASKASSDHFVSAYYHTYNLPVLISNCSNNFGPNQNKEKLIPVVINSILNKQKIPIYGNGKNIRDWLFVDDHIEAIDTILHNAEIGQTYNIGGNNELTNLELVRKIIEITSRLINEDKESILKLISFVEDRKGHDYRYSIDNSKLKNNLGWSPSHNFEKSLEKTIKWYIKKT